MRNYIPAKRGNTHLALSLPAANEDGNATCYIIYEVLKIKINQLLRKNTSIPGLDRNSSLGSVSEESTVGCYF